MAKKPETIFKERILPLLRALPGVWAEKIQQVAIRGTPDILLCVRGQFVALELKSTEDGEPDGLQEYNLEKILRAGGMAVVVNPTNWPEVYNVLKRMSAGTLKFRESEFEITVLNS